MRPNTVLVYMGSIAVNQAGGVVEGDSWHYLFAEPRPGSKLFEWKGRSDGATVFYGESVDVLHIDRTEIPATLRTDSDRAASLGRQYGAQAFVDRYPRTVISMICRFQGGRLVWEMRFFDPPPDGFRCELPIYIDAQTEELLARNLGCLSLTP